MSQALARTAYISDTAYTASASHTSILSRLSTAFEAARTRRALARLDATQLCDIGITPEEARAEANRPLWDAPRSWRM